MPDKHHTDPEVPIPEETPTRPDLIRVRCPKCKGTGKPPCKVCHDEGRVLDLAEWGTQHRAIARLCTACSGKVCSLCGGVGTVDRQTIAHFHAERQGRPHR